MDTEMEKIIQEYTKDIFEMESPLWSKRHRPGTSISEILSKYSLEELHGIVTGLQIEGTSSLPKAELVQSLATKLPLRLQEQVITFDDERYEIISKASSDGYVVVDDVFESFKVEYFQSLGILFPTVYKGKKILVLPLELKVAFEGIPKKDLLVKVKNNTEITRIFQGLIYYYGVMGMEQTTELISHHMDQESLSPLHKVIEGAMDYYNLVSIWEDKYYYFLIQDPHSLAEEIQSRGDIHYYPFTKEQLILAGHENFIDEKNYNNGYLDFLLSYFDLSQGEAETLSQRFVVNVKNGWSFNNIMQIQDELFQLPDMQTHKEFVRVVHRAFYNIPLWTLKGHTLYGLEGGQKNQSNVIDFKTRKIMGRNEPCFCDSGKKFKSCCGK